MAENEQRCLIRRIDAVEGSTRLRATNIALYNATRFDSSTSFTGDRRIRSRSNSSIGRSAKRRNTQPCRSSGATRETRQPSRSKAMRCK